MSRKLLTVEGITKRFGGVYALKDVSFSLEAGDILGVIGPNGSGKTTLINCITGFLRPDAGRVRFEGRDITGLAPHKIARMGLTRTFQVMRPYYSLPAFKNLIIPLWSPRVRKLGGWRGGGKHGDRDTVAVDILEAPDGRLLVNEVNHTPEFHGAMEAVDVDVPGAIADYVIELAKEGR